MFDAHNDSDESTLAAASILFLEPGPLADDELELVAPDRRWVDDMLVACQHPLTCRLDPESATTTRQSLQHFLDTAPGGREAGDLAKGRFPAYHFWMHLRPTGDRGGDRATIRMAGTISLRIGHGQDLERYFGHIGYGVYPPARGHHYAERACRLLFPLARRHGLTPLWITTDPENAASMRTCQRLGGTLVDTVPIPPNHKLYARGQRRKCRFRLEI